jgi:hypothetical protein
MRSAPSFGSGTLTVLAAVGAMIAGVMAGAAWGYGSHDSGFSAYTHWSQFGTQHCGGRRVTVTSRPDELDVLQTFGGGVYSRHRKGSACNQTPANMGQGRLGAYGYAQKENGNLCASQGWSYNSYLTDVWAVGLVGSCNFQSLRVVGYARIYREDVSDFVTSPATSTPYVSGAP